MGSALDDDDDDDDQNNNNKKELIQKSNRAQLICVFFPSSSNIHTIYWILDIHPRKFFSHPS